MHVTPKAYALHLIETHGMDRDFAVATAIGDLGGVADLLLCNSCGYIGSLTAQRGVKHRQQCGAAAEAAGLAAEVAPAPVVPGSSSRCPVIKQAASREKYGETHHGSLEGQRYMPRMFYRPVGELLEQDDMEELHSAYSEIGIRASGAHSESNNNDEASRESQQDEGTPVLCKS